MRLFYFSFFLANFTFSIWSQDISERELKTKLDEVTVFVNGGLVTRSGMLEIPSGNTLIRIKSLSPYIDDKSIQIKGVGDFTILSVNHRLSHLNTLKKDQKIDSLYLVLQSINLNIAKAKARLQILEDQQSLLNANKNLNGNATSPSLVQLKQAIAFFDQELSKIKSEEIESNLQIQALNERKLGLEKEISQTRGMETLPTGEIEIHVSAKNKCKAELSMSYLVANTGWYPKYDIRVSSIDRPLELHYKADIYQNTGVDWENVKLKLSNANPNQSGVAPELQTWFLNYARNTILNRPSFELESIRIGTVAGTVLDETGEPLPGANILVNGSTVGTITDFDGKYNLTLPNGATHLSVSYLGYITAVLPINGTTLNVRLQEDSSTLDEVVVTGYGIEKSLTGRAAGVRGLVAPVKAESISTTTVENQTTIEFEVDTPYSLKSKGDKLTVALNDFEIETHYEYYAAPKLDKDAFLIAHVTNWDQYNLLEGEANLYFENAYVGRTILDARSLADTLSISLGRDKSILLGREKIANYTKRKLIGNSKTESRVYRISVRNKKSQPIKLSLFDQIPVAALSEITVLPISLSEGKWNEKTGEVLWVLEISPQQQKELLLGYEVKYPKNESVLLD
ncbi:MAG: hypothetical protein RLZZ241_862 [Bacteroidota bacterium]|jgi:hypothetical protein